MGCRGGGGGGCIALVLLFIVLGLLLYSLRPAHAARDVLSCSVDSHTTVVGYRGVVRAGDGFGVSIVAVVAVVAVSITVGVAVRTFSRQAGLHVRGLSRFSPPAHPRPPLPLLTVALPHDPIPDVADW